MNTKTQNPSYRKEIDGLRSIAVMAVVLFHFSVPFMSGGFVGVDVFFVISGFLIGGILWEEITTSGRISFVRFYTRRIKRLAPAYVVMALVTFAFAWLIFLPFEFREFGKALIAATLYLSNVLFHRQSGYFDTGVDEKVFLHTWSLSVEEQFYIILPLILLMLSRSKRLMLASLIILFTTSFLASIISTPSAPNAVFYLFPFRAWELLSGVLLAIYAKERRTEWRIGAWASWLGVICILGGIVFIDASKGFPGYQAIFPVLGTVLVILNGRHDNYINTFLSARIPVSIGLISYSLYLWHWPIFVLSQYYFDGYSSPAEPALWIALSVFLAWASWRYIERPFRGKLSMTAGGVFMSAAIASSILLALGFTAYIKDGLPSRFGKGASIHIKASADFLQDWERCETPQAGSLKGIEVCPIGPEGENPEVVIWGDSHLRAFKEGIAQTAREQGVPALIIWHAGCPPLFGITKQETAATPVEDEECTTANKQMRQALPTLGIDRILLVGRWTYYAQGAGVGLDEENKISLSKPFKDAVENTVSELSETFSSIYILRQVPELPQYDSREIARLIAHGKDVSSADVEPRLTISRNELQERNETTDAAFANQEVTIIDPWPFLCDNSICHAVQNGQGYYFDNNHITNTGARLLREIFDPVLARSPSE